MVRPAYFCQNWKAVREDSALAVESMPEGQLDFKPQDDMMSFREIAEHILGVGQALTGLMLDGESDLSTPDFREKIARYKQPVPKDAKGLAAALRTSVAEHAEMINGKSPEFHAEMVTKWDGTRLTRLEMMQFVKEHELTHRMQLFMYLRLNGIVPPTTRRKMEKK